MSDEKSDEKRGLIEHLTDAGFWTAEDKGDPTTDEKALGLLFDRVEKRLAKNVLIFVYGPGLKPSGYEICVAWPSGKYVLASGLTLAEAIYNAALTLSG